MSETSGDAGSLAGIEAAYGKTIPEWLQVVRATPGFGDGGGARSREELVTMLVTDYGVSHEHAGALVDHALEPTDGQG